MREDTPHDPLRPLPWQAFQKALAAELESAARDDRDPLPLRSWLARALIGSAQPAQRC